MLAQKSLIRNNVVSTYYVVMGFAIFLMAMAALVTSGFFSAKPHAAGSPSDYQLYRDVENHFAVSYPNTWQIVSQSDYGVFSASSNIVSQSDQGGTNFSQRQLQTSGVTLPTPSNGFSKFDVIAFKLDAEISSYEFMQAKSIYAPEGNVTPIMIAGKEALRVGVDTGTALQRSENVTYISVFVTSGNYGYIIAGFAEVAVFEKIINSFQTF